MIVYSVTPDVNNYQYFLPEDRQVSVRGELMFDCERRLPNWTPVPLYIHKPKLKRGRFFDVGLVGSSLACDAATRYHDDMAALLEMSGELLPFTYERQEFFIMNVLECVNALDRELSTWHPTMTIKIGSPTNYVFHRSRIPETPLFKIPETSRSEILCAENSYDPAYEFKRMYERLGLTGLRFEKLWTDE